MKTLQIVGMYPSKKDPMFGIFVHKTLNSIEKNVVANYKRKTGIFYTPYKYIIFFLKTLPKFFTRFDIIHAHYIYLPSFFGYFIKIFRGKPLIVTAYGSDINVLPNKSVIGRFIVNLSLKKCDHIITVSNALKQKIIQNFGIKEDKITVIPFGIDEQFKPLDKNKLKEELDIKKDTVLFVGNLVEVKNIDAILAAARKLPDKNFVFIGEGNLKDKILRENLKNVQLLGKKQYKEMPFYMNACDLLVLPSFNEGMPNVILEAMACKLPVVASNVGGIPELLPKEFLFDPTDHNKFVELIKKGGEKIIQQNYKKSQDYSMQNVTKKLLEVYKKYD